MKPSRSIPFLLSAMLVLALASCGHDAKRDNPLDPALTPAVELSVALDDTAGTVALSWTPYGGEAPFAAYWVLRKVADFERVDTLAVFADVEITSYIDGSTRSNVSYEYQISAINASGYEAASERRSIAFSVKAVTLLSAAPDPKSGTIALRWTRFRDPAFESYETRRRTVETAEILIFDRQTKLDDTTFVDDSARSELTHAYSIAVQAGGETLTSNSLEQRLTLPPVAIRSLEFSAATASATVQWLQYTGPRFRSYRVWRRVAGLVPLLAAEVFDRTTTSASDENLIGNTEVFYRVDVLTELDEEVIGEEGSGRFHSLVETWPLELDEADFVRLYWEEPEGQLAILVSGDSGIRLRLLDSDGSPHDEQVLMRASQLAGRFEPRTASQTRSGPVRYLSSVHGNDVRALQYDLQGEPIFRRQRLFEEIADSLSEHESVGFAAGFV